MIRQAVIFVGDDEARPDATPLAALAVGGEPFINCLLWNLARHGITEIIVSCGRPRGLLASAMEAHPVPGVSVRFASDCLPLLDERFFVLQGHSLFDVNYLDLALRAKDGAAVALRRADDASGRGRAELAHGMVREFRKTGQDGPGLVYGGVCCLTRDMVGDLSGGVCFLERDLFPKLAGSGQLAGREYPGFFMELGDAGGLDRARTAVPAWKRKPALFLDRDGVLNVNYGYVHTREKWTWCLGAREAVKFANDAGLLVILVTNQSGIGRRYYDEDAFDGLMAWVREELAAAGAHLDGVYHCPHHPTEGVGEYRLECACRKPNPGMLLQALNEWDIDVEQSAVVGDSEKDLEAGRRAGIRHLKLYDNDRMSLLDAVREVFSFLFDS